MGSYDTTSSRLQADKRQAELERAYWYDKVCPECGRSFNLTSEADADEWYYGHDCEVG